MSSLSSDRPHHADGPPPPPMRTWFPIVRPTPEKQVRAVVVVNRPVGRWGHYAPGSHWIPCDAPAPCHYDHSGPGLRWYAWLGGWILEAPKPEHTGRVGLVELTAGVVQANPWMWAGNANLRGVEITLRRSGAQRGKVYLARSVHVKQQLAVEPFDVRSALVRVWGYVPGCVVRPRLPAFDPAGPLLDGEWDDHAPPL